MVRRDDDIRGHMVVHTAQQKGVSVHQSNTTGHAGQMKLIRGSNVTPLDRGCLG